MEGIGQHVLRPGKPAEEAVRPCVRRIRSSVGQLQHRDNLAPVCRRQLLRRRPDGGRSVKVVYQQVGLAPPDGNRQFPPCRRRQKEHRIHNCLPAGNSELFQKGKPGRLTDGHVIQRPDPSALAFRPRRIDRVHGKAGGIGSARHARRRKLQVEGRVAPVREQRVPYLITARKVHIRRRRLRAQRRKAVIARCQRQVRPAEAVKIALAPPHTRRRAPGKFGKIECQPQSRSVKPGAYPAPQPVVPGQVVRFVIYDVRIVSPLPQVTAQGVCLKRGADVIHVMAGYGIHTHERFLLPCGSYG